MKFEFRVGVLQQPNKRNAQQKARAAERPKDHSPAANRLQHPCDERTGKHEPEVERGLMHRHRKRASFLMVRGKKRIRARPVERLAAASKYRAKEDKSAHSADKPCGRSHKRPEHERNRYYPLSVEPVAEDACKRNGKGESHEKRGVDEPYLQVGEVQLFLNWNREQPEQYAVSLAEEVSQRQQRKQKPLVSASHATGLQ